MKPFLRWAGSKRRLLPHLRAYWNTSFGRYIEPFAGSAAVFFSFEPRRALLADINADLINAYLAVRDECDMVVDSLEKLPKSCKKTYLELRSLDASGLQSHEAASRFIYLNRHCFNGLYRTNLKGQFNVPFSAVKTGAIPSGDVLRICSRQLGFANIKLQPFQRTLASARKGDFVYLDPPYLDSSTRIFKEYDAAGFTQPRLEELRENLVALAKEEIFFVLSFAESDEGRYLAEGFCTKKVEVSRSIAGKAHHRKVVEELIITPF